MGTCCSNSTENKEDIIFPLDCYSEFNLVFDHFIETVFITTSDSVRHRLVLAFLENYNIPRESTSLLAKYTYPTVIPPRIFKEELVKNLDICFTQPRFADQLEALDQSLYFIQQALLVLDQIYASQDPVDRDLYYMLGPSFAASVFHGHMAIRIETLSRILQLPNEERKEIFYYQTTKNNCVIRDGVKVLTDMLNVVKQTLLRSQDSQNNAADVLDSINHVLQHIPERYLIVSPNVLNGAYSRAIYSSRIVLSSNIVKDSEDLPLRLRAQCVIALVHELARGKGTQYFSNVKFFPDSPEKIAYEMLDEETGNILEKYLFGGTVILNYLCSIRSRLILDPQNYSTAEKLDTLKKQLRYCIYGKGLHPDLARCGMRFFKVPEILMEN